MACNHVGGIAPGFDGAPVCAACGEPIDLRQTTRDALGGDEDARATVEAWIVRRMHVLEADGTVRRARDLADAYAALVTTNRTIAYDVVAGVDVSTVFIPFDMGEPLTGFKRLLPLVFETMIFDDDGARLHDRYTTRADALAGHAAAVEEVKRRALN